MIELKLFNVRQLCLSLKLIGYWKPLINIKKKQERRRSIEELFELCGKICGVEYTTSEALTLS